MNYSTLAGVVVVPLFLACAGMAQTTNSFQDKTIIKLIPDPQRPLVYALNTGASDSKGSVMALNSTTGAILGETSVSKAPSDMAYSRSEDCLYVINVGSQNISKINLDSFTTIAETGFTPHYPRYANMPVRITAGSKNMVYYTDGGLYPSIAQFNYANGVNMLIWTNIGAGCGGLTTSTDGQRLYCWSTLSTSRQTGIFRLRSIDLELLDYSELDYYNAQPFDTPILVDSQERWIFNKTMMVQATNSANLIRKFPELIYGISQDGSFAFGSQSIFNTANGQYVTSLPFSTTVQTLSTDQSKLFLYNNTNSSLVVYDAASIIAANSQELTPIPGDGMTLCSGISNLSWNISPIATAYDVYFSKNLSEIQSATPENGLYKGRFTNNVYNLSTALTQAGTYYWRVDTVNLFATNKGPVWSFTIFPLELATNQINTATLVGFDADSVTLNVKNLVPLSHWSTTIQSSWATVTPSASSAASAVTITFDTKSFELGSYTNRITFSSMGFTYDLPIVVNVRPLNLVKMVTDMERPYIYGIQAPGAPGEIGFGIILNTQTGNIEKKFNAGINPTDLAIHYPEKRLYIASLGSPETYVMDLETQQMLPSLKLGTNIIKINASKAGRIITEGDAPTYPINLVDSSTGAILSSFPPIGRPGDGECDPTGNYYYHCLGDYNFCLVLKYDCTSDTPVHMYDSSVYWNGMRNLVVTPDGKRVIWGGFMFDQDLKDVGTFPELIYNCSPDGQIAFGSSYAYSIANQTPIHPLPQNTGIFACDNKNDRLWYFNAESNRVDNIIINSLKSPFFGDTQEQVILVDQTSSTSLAPTAYGMAPFSYQWTFQGVNLPGKTNEKLDINNATPSQDGYYQLVASNPWGSATSAVMRVIVQTVPSVVSHSDSTNLPAGSDLTFSVLPAGGIYFNYYWYFEDKLLGMTTVSNYTLSNLQVTNSGNYSVIVSNQYGCCTNSVMSLHVQDVAPRFTLEPQDVTIQAGRDTTLRSSAVGTDPIHYQWYYNGKALNGATASSLLLTNVTSTNLNSYYVVAQNSLGATTSRVATLSTTPQAPFLVNFPPLTYDGYPEQYITLECSVAGSLPISYQWQHAGTNIPGANNPTYIIPSLGNSDIGTYTCIATNSYGSYKLNKISVAYAAYPVTVKPLTNQIVDVGDTVTLSYTAFSTKPLTYNWYFNEKAIPGKTNTLIITNIQPSQTGFYSVASSYTCWVTSSLAQIVVIPHGSAVAVWGDNTNGINKTPKDLNDVIALAAGENYTLGLRRDGSLTAWGNNDAGQCNVPTNSQRYLSIAAGASHGLAVLQDGTVTAWGDNSSGQTTIPPTAVTNVYRVAAGKNHSMALHNPYVNASGKSIYGYVEVWGDNTYGQTSLPYNWDNISAIAAGQNHCLALRLGTVYAWGDNSHGQTTIPSNLNNVMAIAAGYEHSVALLTNGTVVAWGDNTFGQTNVPQNLTNVVSISAGQYYTLAQLADGRVVGWGDNRAGQLNIPTNVTHVFSISAGYNHALALIAPPPTLRIGQDTSGIQIRWNGAGILQSAPSPIGPFTDVPCETNYFQMKPGMDTPAQFFRLRQ